VLRAALGEFVAGLFERFGVGWVFLGLDGAASLGGFEAFGLFDDEVGVAVWHEPGELIAYFRGLP